MESENPTPADIVLSGHVMRLAMHPSASIIAASSVTGEVQLHEYSLEGNKILSKIAHHKQSCRALQFSSDGSTLFSGAKDANIGAFDLGAMKPSGMMAQAHSTAVSSLLVIDESILASGDDDGVVKIWDLRQRRCCHELKEHEDFISDMKLAEDGRTLLCAGGDGYLSVWNRKSGKLLAMSDQLDDEFLSLAIVKSGQKVVCGCQSGTLAIFKWGDWGDVTDRFPGHPQSVESMVKVDEDSLLTCSEDGIIRVVSIQPNKLLGVIGEHDGYPIEHMDLSHDKALLASCAHDERVKFWGVAYLFQDPGDDSDEEGGEEGDVDMAGSDADSDDSDAPAGGGKKKGGGGGARAAAAAADPRTAFYADML